MGDKSPQGDGQPGIPGQDIVLGGGAVQDQGVVIPYGLGRCLGVLTDFTLFSLKDKGQEYQKYGEDGYGYDG